MKRFMVSAVTVVMLILFSLQCFAYNFVVSPTQAGTPTIISQEVDGNEYSAVFIKKSDGEVVAGVPKENLIITPIAQADSSDESVKTELYNAYDSIENSQSISEAVPGFDEAVRAIDASLDPESFVVRDLFSISIDGKYNSYLNEDNQISLRFDTKLSAQSPLVVMQYVNGKWHIISPDNIIRHGDGSVTVLLDSLGVLAFAVDANEIDPDAPKSPYTGDMRIIMLAGGLVCIAILGSAVVLIRRKQKFGGMAS